MMTRLVCAFVVLAATSMSWAQSYAIDPIHSSFLFKVLHADTANFYGRFNKTSGLVKLDAGALTELNIVVDADSVDTNNKARDEHLKSPDFFSTKDFPEISFKSTSVKKIDETNFEVTGDLTLHGTTKSIAVKVTKTGAGKNVQGKEVVGFETTFAIKRTEYGVSGYVGKGVGDDVTLIISIEAGKQ